MLFPQTDWTFGRFDGMSDRMSGGQFDGTFVVILDRTFDGKHDGTFYGMVDETFDGMLDGKFDRGFNGISDEASIRRNDRWIDP